MSKLRLNGHPVVGSAVLETLNLGQQQIQASITVPSGSPAHQVAREAVLANYLEVTLEGGAHEPLKDEALDFRAKGQLVNGRIGSDIKADFKSTTFARLLKKDG